MFKTAITQFDGFRVYFWLNHFFLVIRRFSTHGFSSNLQKIQFFLRQVFAPGLSHATHILNIVLILPVWSRSASFWHVAFFGMFIVVFVKLLIATIT